METWVQKRSSATENMYLPALFYHYVDADLVEMTRRGYKEVTSLCLINNNKVRQHNCIPVGRNAAVDTRGENDCTNHRHDICLLCYECGHLEDH